MAQPHRGNREFIGVRVPPDVNAAVRAEATRLGFRSMSDYVASILAEHHGLPFHARMANHHDQEGLPLTG